ncbi:MAG: ACT domain-containing protein [Kineosporiaceae bacterium]
MLARLRISVPDRPGMLGRVASAIGQAGGDIVRVAVLDSEGGRATDDVHVEVRDAEHVARVSDALSAVVGLTVTAVQHPVPPASGHADLELLAQVLQRPERALITLVDGAPAALAADWAAAVRYVAGDPHEVVALSHQCPGPEFVAVRAALRLSAVRIVPPGRATPYVGAALVPLQDDLALVLVREEGPEYHPWELWRLEQVGRIAGTALPHA